MKRIRNDFIRYIRLIRSPAKGGIRMNPLTNLLGIYLFIAPAVSPEIICLWKKRNMMITGKVHRLEAAKR
jgi:hypothetical protein